MTATEATEYATRLVLSYPADLSKHGQNRIQQPHFRRYLRHSHATASVGDQWEEFTDIGCCGNQQSVPLQVETIEGGAKIGDDTTIEFIEREACGLDNGWAVQGDDPEPA